MGIKAQLKIMNAFREGKPIQRVCTGGVGYYPWEDVSGDHSFDFNHFEYRIKPEITYRAYTAEELNEELLGRSLAVKEKTTGIIYTIAAIDGTEVHVFQKDGSTIGLSTCEMLEKYTWRDGDVFGVKNQQ